MLKKLALAVALTLTSLTSAACDGSVGFTVPSKVLKPGGVFVAFNSGCESGCKDIVRGDLIQEIDGKAVKTSDDFDNAKFWDGKPHTLKVLKLGGETKSVEIIAKPNNQMPPIKDAPPFWTVGAEQLNKAPEDPFFRRRLFGHAMPQLVFASIDGGFVTGRDFIGKPRLMVLWSNATQTDRIAAVSMLHVLQKAQADLKNRGVDMMYVNLQFPGRNVNAWQDQRLREYFSKNQLPNDQGGPLPPPPFFRAPNAQEQSGGTRMLGMEGAFSMAEAMGESPVVLVVDKRGIIRWHSAGLKADPNGKIPNDAVFTIVEAANFARDVISTE